MGHHQRMDPAKMQEMVAKRQAALKAQLKLSAAQKKNAEDNRGKTFLYGKYTKTTVRGETVRRCSTYRLGLTV